MLQSISTFQLAAAESEEEEEAVEAEAESESEAEAEAEAEKPGNVSKTEPACPRVRQPACQSQKVAPPR